LNNDTISPDRLPDVAQEIRTRIESSKRQILVSHVRPDGDAIGAELGLANILEARGLSPHIVNDSIIPHIYRFLPGAEGIATSAAAVRDDYDLAVVLDLPTWKRAREIRKRLRPDLPAVTIDHHLRLERMGDLEWVDPAMSSVGEMVYLLARASGWRIPPAAATCLYVAIVTDCGRFTFSNTTPSALRAAADLIELGADHHLVTEMVYRAESLALKKLEAELVQGLRTYVGGKIALITVTREMLKRHGVDPIDTQDLPDIPRSLSGVVVGVLLRELTEKGKIKVSLRSRNELDVEPIARKFGGGGHHAAAGCEITGDLATVEQIVVAEVTGLLKAGGIIGEQG